MSVPISSQQDLYQTWLQTLLAVAPDLTDTFDGSILDGLAGTYSIAATEILAVIVDQFSKTFFDLANGPEITGGPDDLQTLAVDHYGQAFGRPQAVAAIDTVTFARPNNAAGSILIPAGTIVKTKPDANGSSQRYSTNVAVTLTNASVPSDTSVTVNVTAVVAGAAGSAAAGTIAVIESSLLDSTITVSNVGNSTGADAQDDATYRETIRNLIESIAGATIQAVQAKAKTVAGVITATAVEQAMTVIAYNPATATTSGTWFNIPVPYLYISDSTGTASPALLAAVRTAIDIVRACGVMITVAAASSQTVNWTASYTLNPSGPNYSTFSTNNSAILAAMKNYINGLPIGTSFVRATANAAILAIYGPSGTNDLTAFTTSVPSGDVSATPTTKMIAGTMSTV